VSTPTEASFAPLGQEGGGLAQAGLHLVPERAELPVTMLAPEVAVGVGETVRLGEREPFFDQAPRMTRPLVAPRSTAAVWMTLAMMGFRLPQALRGARFSNPKMLNAERKPVTGKKVQLMATCLCDAIYADVAKATVEVLEHAGCTIDFPEGQTCCGQPAFNGGDWTAARKVVRHAVRTFTGGDPVILPSGSCAAMMFSRRVAGV
jgi:Fe-S oxidoreductase